MRKKPKTYDDDDGRTIADMSGVSGGSLHWFGRLPHSAKKNSHTAGEPEDKTPSGEFETKERWSAALGALSAALLIGLVFIVLLGLLVLLMVLVWR